jgi:hypothetical protein
MGACTHHVWIDGAGMHSRTNESTDPAAVSEARHTLGLNDLKTVNYLQAIKRVTSMAPPRTPYY